MKYKTELHCHSGDVSNCAKSSADFIANKYIGEGYKSLVVTNHMSRYTFAGQKYITYLENTGKEDSWQTKIDFYMTGYNNLIKAADRKMNIILGIEFRSWIREDPNDYLVFGVTEEWLRTSEKITEMKIKEMSAYVHESGFLIYQAHPFRNEMMIVNPKYLDGVEVYNVCTSDFRNEVALKWAEHYELKQTSGSDFHNDDHRVGGGILTDKEIKSSDELLEVLRSGEYELIFDGYNKVQ